MTWVAAPLDVNLTTREQFESALVDEKAWAIVASKSLSTYSQVESTQRQSAVNQNATDNLNRVLSSGAGPYNGSLAVTIYVNEARSSNAV